MRRLFLLLLLASLTGLTAPAQAEIIERTVVETSCPGHASQNVSPGDDAIAGRNVDRRDKRFSIVNDSDAGRVKRVTGRRRQKPPACHERRQENSAWNRHSLGLSSHYFSQACELRVKHELGEF